MKRAVIVHCWDGDPLYAWYPYVASKLGRMKFKVTTPFFWDFPLPHKNDRLKILSEAAGKPDENLYLIGHSLGVVTILNYLQSLPEGKAIAGAVLVAGFADNLGLRVLDEFFDPPLDFGKIRKSCRQFVAVYSQNDPYISWRQVHALEENLGAETILIRRGGHFTPETSHGFDYFPEIINITNKLAHNNVPVLNKT